MSNYIKEISVGNKFYKIFDINRAANDVGFDLQRLPYSLRILFENVLRHNGTAKYLSLFKDWLKNKQSEAEIPFMPARVLMQDFTGVPAIVDLAAMRDAMKKLGGDPLKINPLIPVDLVIDHSVQVDYSAADDSFAKNVQMEVQRNIERYEFLKWGQEVFNNFKVVPPGTGICHQVNLEYLAKVVWTKEEGGETFAYPDTLVGTDSHTTMINGLAVLGWGVGGIEAEAAMLGQSLSMIIPEVVGFKITGAMKGMINATDLVLTVTQMLRKKNVVGKFVEFYGDGLDSLTLADRATISNMSPEFGATCGFFPIDSETIKYLQFTARERSQIHLVEEYAKLQSLWREPKVTPEYSDFLELDLSTLEMSLAGPKRPQDRVSLVNVASNFQSELPSLTTGGSNINTEYPVSNKDFALKNGSVVIAAITSCTNTSNPVVMIAAGLVAKKALELGLSKKPWVKTSLAPGSKVVTEYLHKAGLTQYLNNLGFNLVGYGCTTCIGNSGPLTPEIEENISTNNLVVAAVLSGNRNFEGRIHPLTRANYLASPPLVVAYALAGTVNIDLDHDPIGKGLDGKEVYLKDLWPSRQEIERIINNDINSQMFSDKYADVFLGDKEWRDLKITKTNTYNWSKVSTYINNPPYFEGIENKSETSHDIESARILAIFGDSITTDHISPAGNINKTSPAAKYLIERNIAFVDFNSYGARRGNHEVMIRGTFANSRIKNEICQGVEGGVTVNQLNGNQMSIYDAAMDYKAHSIPLVIFAGKEYGTGSSRDWAAKGTNLLGVKAVIAESFERIHRSNLVGMGVLPLVFSSGNRHDLKLDGSEYVTISGLNNNIRPYQELECVIKKKSGVVETVKVILQVFTDNEVDYIKHGSIMHLVVKNLKG
jgi:aconitate hydratase